VVSEAVAVQAPRNGLLLTAAAGYGKTAFLEDLLAGTDYAVRSAAELAADPARLAGGPHLVIDGVPDLPHRAQLSLARAVAALPEQRVLVSLTCRQPLGPRVLSALRRPLSPRGPADLALSPQAVAGVLRDEYGVPDPEVASAVGAMTAGWPGLVRLAGAALRRGTAEPDLLAAITDPGAPSAVWIQEEILTPMPVEVRRVLERLIDLDPVTPELLTTVLAAIGSAATEQRVSSAVRWLRATGLLVPCLPPGRGAAMRVVPVIAHTVAQLPRVVPGSAATDRSARGFTAAAAWYLERDLPLAAARSRLRSGDPVGAATLIETRGADMIAAGSAAGLLGLIEDLPAPERGRYGVQLNRADALRTVGEPAAAGAVFAALRLESGGAVTPALAWREGMLHYMKGDFRRAAACARGAASGAAPDVDVVLAEVCRVSALYALGQTWCSAAIAGRALRLASELGSEGGLAAAHLAVALTSAGARSDGHLAQAGVAAEHGNDVLLQARVLTNQVDRLLHRAQYPQALELAQRALVMAEKGSPPGLLVTALCNAGEIELRLGRFDDAARSYERAVRTSRRAGLNRTAMGLCGLAEGYRQSGRREQARAVFEEALDLAREGRDVQVLVPALIGLSRLLLDDEVAVAVELAQEAQRAAPPRLAVPALVGLGWAGLAEGDRAVAGRAATEAVALARAECRMDHLAEALELSAAVSVDSGRTRALLREAESIWRQAGATSAADRIALLVGRLPEAGGDERSAGRAAAERLTLLGVKCRETGTEDVVDGPAAPVTVRVLGGFEVRVGGRPVPFATWRSKQARTLIKILVAQRGRPIQRDELCELLWPDDDQTRTSHRLSVLLSVVRQVLDPQHLWSADHYLRADSAGLGLDPTHLAVDAEGLLRDAAHARELIRRGETARARKILVAVDQQYRGAAFEEEPFEAWACRLREEVRAVWLRCLRELADLHRTGDPRQAVTLLVRLLGEDPYDEDTHHRLVRLLVRSGRHGEARRAFTGWVQAMRRLGAPEPDPGVLGLPVRAAGS
jgi:DNA-binding SARP family transcriptional activator/tetratricopeptide (TPR) repeat protein